MESIKKSYKYKSFSYQELKTKTEVKIRKQNSRKHKTYLSFNAFGKRIKKTYSFKLLELIWEIKSVRKLK